MKTIPINIWDDYYEDGYVPEGEKQETYIYVEDDEMLLEDRKKCLEEVLIYIDNFHEFNKIKVYMSLYDSKIKYPKLTGPEHGDMHFKRWEIRVENMTHKMREKLVEKLNKASLSINGVPFEIYSES